MKPPWVSNGEGDAVTDDFPACKFDHNSTVNIKMNLVGLRGVCCSIEEKLNVGYPSLSSQLSALGSAAHRRRLFLKTLAPLHYQLLISLHMGTSLRSIRPSPRFYSLSLPLSLSMYPSIHPSIHLWLGSQISMLSDVLIWDWWSSWYENPRIGFSFSTCCCCCYIRGIDWMLGFSYWMRNLALFSRLFFPIQFNYLGCSRARNSELWILVIFTDCSWKWNLAGIVIHCESNWKLTFSIFFYLLYVDLEEEIRSLQLDSAGT